MLNYSKLCLIMLCTRSTFPSTQQARTKCLFCRNPYLGIQTSLWYWCKSRLITRSLKEKRKGRLLQAQAKPRAEFWVGKYATTCTVLMHRELRALWLLCTAKKKTSTMSCHAHLKLRGGRKQTRTHRPLNPLFRVTYSRGSENWKTIYVM